ncbi:Ldh family oxidoreductase [Polycladidibacter stylochi]|uniref:Ldh family oxidoreductase n=1 Tax=Polycladidibacter stylochi TaxID=1807766 RepID=UPI000836EC68|nr:Ldh family oxidoreductase [Pseudovibrio stylochi]
MTDVKVSIEELKKLAVAKLTAAGLNAKSADEVADVLVYADSHGVRSHGVLRVEHYCKRLTEGGMNKNASMSFEQVSASAAVLDSDDGMGHSGMILATEKAIEMAKETGIGIVPVKKTSHCGALAYFVEMAAKAGTVGISMTQTDSCVAPFGGAEKFFGTNPIAFGFPVKGKEPAIFDMATSGIAFGKVLHAKETGGKLPEQSALDADGNYTTDPEKFATLTPFGAHKGYGVAFAIEALTGVLMGAQFGPHINKMYGDYSKMRGLASLMLVIDPAKFGTGNYADIMANMVNELHAAKPAPGNETVMVPGDPQHAYFADCQQNGVPVAKPVYDFLVS